MRHNPDGDNYPSISNYVSEMSLTGTYGSFCELVAATQLYPICIEVYYNGKLYVKHGNNDNPVKRLKFSGNFSGGHFNVYIPWE
ncbi:hypothetical protein CVS40_11486 [Lucilia cuprina]|nr:hypothetical protein CVS40_11486 [Lucilia cuprina]